MDRRLMPQSGSKQIIVELLLWSIDLSVPHEKNV